MKFSVFARWLWLNAFICGLLGPVWAAKKPNMVFFITDDLSLRDVSSYGATDVHTPNMQRLSADGMTFNKAFVASPSCAPSRAAFLSGLMPARNGAEPNHSRPRPDVKLLPAYLHEQGYEVVSFGKVGHYNQTKDFGFDLVRYSGFHEDECVNAALDYLKERTSEKPLAFFVGTNFPHMPWPQDNESYKSSEVKVPPIHVDTAQTRESRTHYYAAVARADRELGQVYDLAREKLGKDTFFLFSSDHGAQWPFGKWNCYDEGIHVPFIVSWPGVTKAGTRTDAMVQWIDILPTMIEVAGGKAPRDLDGRSFVPVLRNPKQKHRDRIFTTHSGDGNFNVYPIRSVRTSKWHYIWNLHPEFAFTSHVDKHPDRIPDDYWPSWKAKAQTNARAAQIVQRYRERPAEELYDVEADPNEQNNVAANPAFAKIKNDLHQELEAWMKSQNDGRKVFNTPQLLSDENKVATPEITTPNIANKTLTISCEVTAQSSKGVILAQGGDRQGYALHLQGGKPVFSVRRNQVLVSIVAPDAPQGKFSLEAHLEKDGVMTLAVNGTIAARGKAAGLIEVQPAEGLEIGQDGRGAVGNYIAPGALQGKVENVKIVAQ